MCVRTCNEWPLAYKPSCPPLLDNLPGFSLYLFCQKTGKINTGYAREKREKKHTAEQIVEAPPKKKANKKKRSKKRINKEKASQPLAYVKARYDSRLHRSIETRLTLRSPHRVHFVSARWGPRKPDDIPHNERRKPCG